jgi:hypothetical protein
MIAMSDFEVAGESKLTRGSSKYLMGEYNLRDEW